MSDHVNWMGFDFCTNYVALRFSWIARKWFWLVFPTNCCKAFLWPESSEVSQNLTFVTSVVDFWNEDLLSCSRCKTGQWNLPKKMRPRTRQRLCRNGFFWTGHLTQWCLRWCEALDCCHLLCDDRKENRLAQRKFLPIAANATQTRSFP